VTVVRREILESNESRVRMYVSTSLIG